MRLLPALLCFVVFLHTSFAPPVTPDKNNEKDSEVKDDLEEYMEYHRYLREVVQTLENDTEFRERLEKANEDDIRSGKIAEHLDFVNHNVRTKLDEIKRLELERLRSLASKQNALNSANEIHKSRTATGEHLDHENPYTFEVEDLRKLIQKTTADLEAADKQRKEEFKEYEMQKEFEKKQQLEGLDEAEKKRFEERIKYEEDTKKRHQPLHHPGSKQQLEEVWEKQDQMDQQFDPKAFFMMHDVDGNGVWDADEVKALFIKELDKIYGPNGPNKDLHERAEEMERMREHVFGENDKNHDGLIDFSEFMAETQKANFNHDEGWKSIDENQIYTQAEYDEFQRKRLEEVHYLQSRGLVDAHGRPLPGAQHQIHQAIQQFRSMQMQNQQMSGHGGAYPQGQVPQGHHADPSLGYPGAPQGYPPQGQAYQAHQGYPAQGQQGHPQQQGYQPPAQQGYQPPAQQGYQPPAQQGYQPPPQQGYQQQGYQQAHQQAPNQNAPQGQPQNVQYQAQVPQNNNQVPVEKQAQVQQQPSIQASGQQKPQVAAGNPSPAQNVQPSNPPPVQNQQTHGNPPSLQGQHINSINEIPKVSSV